MLTALLLGLMLLLSAQGAALAQPASAAAEETTSTASPAPAASETPPNASANTSQASETPSALSLRRTDGRLVLSAHLQWQLPAVVQEALLKGIPVQFFAQVWLQQPRWYWRDRNILSAQRHWRLSYQPLTRHWRVQSTQGSADPALGTGLNTATLGLTFDHLGDALAAMQRISHWELGSDTRLPADTPLRLRLEFGIDISHFPRPLQIGTLGREDWNLLLRHELDIPAQSL